MHTPIILYKFGYLFHCVYHGTAFRFLKLYRVYSVHGFVNKAINEVLPQPDPPPPHTHTYTHTHTHTSQPSCVYKYMISGVWCVGRKGVLSVPHTLYSRVKAVHTRPNWLYLLHYCTCRCAWTDTGVVPLYSLAFDSIIIILSCRNFVTVQDEKYYAFHSSGAFHSNGAVPNKCFLLGKINFIITILNIVSHALILTHKVTVYFCLGINMDSS